MNQLLLQGLKRCLDYCFWLLQVFEKNCYRDFLHLKDVIGMAMKRDKKKVHGIFYLMAQEIKVGLKIV